MPCRKTTPCRLGALLVCALVFFAACQEPQNGESPSGSFVQSEDMIYEGGWAWEAMVPNRYNTSDERPVVSVWTLTDTHLSPLSDVSIGDIYDRDREYNIKVHYALTWHTPESAYRMYTQEEEDEQVRRLITELLAGEGPDVLILDGCNARDFAARGALMDLAGVAREMGVYENLTQGLVINGQLPYIPYLARAPLLWGPPEEVQGVESFAQLAESMMAGPTPQWPGPFEGTRPEDLLLLNLPPLPEDKRSVVNFSIGNGYASPEFLDLAEALYLPRLVQDGALDTAVLQDYYALLKRIYAVNEAYPIFNFPLIQFPADYVYHLGESGGSLYLGYARLAAASTGYGSPSYLTPAFTALVQNQPIVVRPFPTQAGALWQPHVLMAVNINSKNPQLALRFIRDMLSDEYQVGNPGYGDFPVTQSAVQLLTTQRLNHMFQLAYANLVEMYGENHAGIQWLKEPTIEIPFDLDALIRSFDTVYLPEPVIQDAVSSNLWLYISEELTLDEAVAACEQTVALYLAERQ